MKAYLIIRETDFRFNEIATNHLYDSYHAAAKFLSMCGYIFHKQYVHCGYFYDVWVHPDLPMVRYYIVEYDIKKSEDL